MTATDVVDGDRPVACSHAGTFPIGDTLVTCSSSDSRGNNASETFTVRVTDVTVPGTMHEYGFIDRAGVRYEFGFAVRENASSGQRATLLFKVKARQRSHHAGDGHFVATSTSWVGFDGSTVLFSGTGRWNGAAGLHYEARAVDNGEPGRHQDVVRITITDSGGTVVAQADGTLSGGNVQLSHSSH